MPLDAELANILKETEKITPIHKLTPAQVRKRRDAMPTRFDRTHLDVEDLVAATTYGDLAVRVYRPEGARRPTPAVVFFHGSGWVFCSLDTHDLTVSRLTRASGCILVSVDYPLAPEAKFPEGIEASYAATLWVSENADRLGIDGSRIAVAGDSAGGNIAAVVALMARDRGAPDIAFQLLAYPICDLHMERPSYRENDGFGLSRKGMEWFAGHYLADDGERRDWRVSPLLAPSLESLPPTLIIAAEYDVLRDSALAFAQALTRAGNKVRLIREPDMNHGFWGNSTARGPQSLHECGEILGFALRDESDPACLPETHGERPDRGDDA